MKAVTVKLDSSYDLMSFRFSEDYPVCYGEYEAKGRLSIRQIIITLVFHLNINNRGDNVELLLIQQVR
jgi:hypothetical protein